MKKVFILIFFLWYSSCAASLKDESHQISYEKLQLSFDFERATLFCLAEIEIRNNTSYVISLGLPEEAKINNVLLNKDNVNFKRRGRFVEINIKPSLENFTLILDYSIKFGSNIKVQDMTFENPSNNLVSHISQEGVFIGGDIQWYPIFNNKPEKREIIFTSPLGYEFVTEGLRVTHDISDRFIKSKWLIEKEINRLPIVGGPYLVKTKNLNDLQLLIYFSKENYSYTDRYMEALVEYLNFYTNLIGPYPYKKFAVVETILPVGISYQTFTIIHKNLIKLPFLIESSFPHEILHSWFGNGVFINYSKGNWSEGLVTYLADYMIKERKSKKEAIDYLKKLTIDYSSVIKEGNDFSLRQFYGRYDLTSRVIGYGKSAMFFHYLRFFMGDEKFFEALRDFYQKNLLKTASWDDLERSFVNSYDNSLKVLFKQWVERKGIPDIDITNANKEKLSDKWLIKLSLIQNSQDYLLKLPVTIYNKLGKVLLADKIILKDTFQEFKLETLEEPYEIRINESYDVLIKLDDYEIPPTINSIKSAKNVLLLVNNNYFKNESIERFAKTMGLKNYRITNKVDRDFDAIVSFGIDEVVKNGDILIKNDFFEYGGEIYKGDRDGIFLVTKRGNKFYAYFKTFSTDGASELVPKITHYGAFSYLIFRDGKNTHKGLIEPEKSELIFKF